MLIEARKSLTNAHWGRNVFIVFTDVVADVWVSQFEQSFLTTNDQQWSDGKGKDGQGGDGVGLRVGTIHCLCVCVCVCVCLPAGDIKEAFTMTIDLLLIVKPLCLQSIVIEKCSHKHWNKLQYWEHYTHATPICFSECSLMYHCLKVTPHALNSRSAYTGIIIAQYWLKSYRQMYLTSRWLHGGYDVVSL